MDGLLRTILTGERISLRPAREIELEAYFSLLQEPEASRLTGTQQRFSKESIAAWLKKISHVHDDRVDLMIALLDTDELIGEVVLNELDPINRSANIRIVVSARHSNKGYGSEAMRLMLKHGFEDLKLHRIELGVYAFNPRALHVYEKLGFKREGVKRDAIYTDGRFHDMILMAMLEEEFRARSSNAE